LKDADAALSNLATRDVETLVHPYINLSAFRETGPLIIERGQGVMVYDTEGNLHRRYGRLWCTALGYATRNWSRQPPRRCANCHSRTFHRQEPRSGDRACDKLKEIAPVPISKTFFCNSGSEANDTQVNSSGISTTRSAVRRRKDREPDEGLSRVTIVAASLTGLPGNHRISICRCRGFLHTACRIITASANRRKRGGFCDASCRRTRRA